MRRRVIIALMLGWTVSLTAAPLVDFPTNNHALAEGHPEEFFMYVNRDFEGEKSKPWQGGQFGFVRNPRREAGRVIFIQLHEGIDILPLQRDAQGNPLDTVKAAADGRVVHVSTAAGASNYGRYAVIEHLWDGSPCYTLYAHLATISVQPGQTVRQGEPIGVMGFTGDGIDRERAHVHFEVALMLNRNFPSWHDAFFPGNPNRHGNYNGLNLVGVDPSRLLLEAGRNPGLRFRDYVSTQEPAFRLAIPNTPGFDLIRLYPWLVPAGEPANPAAWAVTFSRHGVPIKVEALRGPVASPVLWVKETDVTYSHATKGLITGPKGSPRLSDSGVRFVKLLTWEGSATTQ